MRHVCCPEKSVIYYQSTLCVTSQKGEYLGYAIAKNVGCEERFNLLAPELFFFLTLAHPVYKM